MAEKIERTPEKTRALSELDPMVRWFGFSRSFRLPDDAETDRVEASFKDGVLTIEVPRAEEKKPKVIKIL